MTIWLARWGFAILVAAAYAVGVWAGGTADVPSEVPDYALQAVSVYRLEIGALYFAAGYVLSLAFVLALGNRGFTELGASGVKAHALHDVTLEVMISRHEEMLVALAAQVAELQENAASNSRLKGSSLEALMTMSSYAEETERRIEEVRRKVPGGDEHWERFLVAMRHSQRTLKEMNYWGEMARRERRWRWR